MFNAGVMCKLVVEHYDLLHGHVVVYMGVLDLLCDRSLAIVCRDCQGLLQHVTAANRCPQLSCSSESLAPVEQPKGQQTYGSWDLIGLSVLVCI
jgi:hypothetical protein